MRSFVKIRPSRNDEITMSLTGAISKSGPSREMLKLQICILTLFAKINFSRKFPDLQYPWNYHEYVYILFICVF